MAKGIPNKRYTGEFKQKVVEAIKRDGLSYKEAARIFEIKSDRQVRNWERIYLEEGPEGLYQRLRAENAYLKKLRALVLEEERRGKGRK